MAVGGDSSVVAVGGVSVLDCVSGLTVSLPLAPMEFWKGRTMMVLKSSLGLVTLMNLRAVYNRAKIKFFLMMNEVESSGASTETFQPGSQETEPRISQVVCTRFCLRVEKEKGALQSWSRWAISRH